MQPGGVWVRSLEEGEYLIAFPSHRVFLILILRATSQKKLLYFVTDTKLISTGAWPCHVPKFFQSARARRNFMVK